MSSEKIDLLGREGTKGPFFVDCGHSGDSGYSTTTGITITSDYTPTNTMHGLLLTAGSGNIDVSLVGGGRMVFPFTVDTGTSTEALRGYRIKTVHSSATTTFNGYIFPLF